MVLSFNGTIPLGLGASLLIGSAVPVASGICPPTLDVMDDQNVTLSRILKLGSLCIKNGQLKTYPMLEYVGM